MKSRAVAILAARKAGAYLLREFKRGVGSFALKSSHEILTKADKGAERIILPLLKKYTPGYQILSEESGLTKRESDWLWVVDPLDGTTNFKVHNPLFSVSIALYCKGEPRLGVVYAPYLNELFVAEKGKGAWLNGKRLHVSKTSELKKSFLTYCYGTKPSHMRAAVELYRYFKMKSVDMRQLGSAAIELAWVAAGRTESIVIPGTHPWDAAAGALIVTEAGGKVTDFQGKPWRFVKPRARARGKTPYRSAAGGSGARVDAHSISLSVDLLATNGKLHRTILKHL